MVEPVRCPWCGTDPLYVAYHDAEWGVPLRDPRALWEMLVLEGFQAGLSWITILRRRAAFRAECDGFDPERIVAWEPARVEKALKNEAIIRHRGKIEAMVRGARAFLAIESAEGFAPFLWSVTGGVPVQNAFASPAEVPAATPESAALSRALKASGFGFCGPVICYAFMQATGMVNDHLTSCHRHAAVRALSGH